MNAIKMEVFRKYQMNVFPVIRTNIILQLIPTISDPACPLHVSNVIRPIRVGVLLHINSMIPGIFPFTPEAIKVNGIAVRNVTPIITIRHLIVRIAMNTHNRK